MNRNPRPHIPRLSIPRLPPKDLMMLPHLPHLSRLPEITRRTLAITYMLVLLSACGGQDTTRTGFIGNYDGMKPTKAHTADLIFVDPGYEPGQYRAAFLDTVEWTPAPDSPTRSPEVIAELTADFRKSLTEKLARSFVIVPKPAPGSVAPAGVLRIRGAITNTRKANWWLNLPVQVLGVGLSVVGLPGLPPPNPGGASEEMEALDAESGKRVVAVATYNNGMPWNILGYYQEFGHARRAFDIAAGLLHEQLRPVATDAAAMSAQGPIQRP